MSFRLDTLVAVTFENACLKSDVAGNKRKENE